jgi:hypothetical protein
MRKVLRLFGKYPLLSIDFEGFLEESEEEAEEEDDGPAFVGGSSHNFDRDHDPLIAEDDGKDYDTWIQRPFGFAKGDR